MKKKASGIIAAAVLAFASLFSFGATVGSQVPGSDHSSEPCTPKQRTDEYGTSHFNADRSESAGKNCRVVLFGDSITDFWIYAPSNLGDAETPAINMGIGSDRVQHLLWRVRNGALDGYTTEYFTLMIGVNNGYQKHVDNHSDPCDRAEDVAESIRLVLSEMVTKHPNAKILLMPILPYGFDSRYYPALDVRNVNEDINDYIIKFVDYKNVFWVDLRSQYLNSDATCKKSVFGGPGGNYDAVGHYLHPHTDSYPVIWKPALEGAMVKYHDVAGGQPHVADPSLAYADVEPNADGAGTATVTVRGILTGTDSSANPVETYSISYELDGGAETVALVNQSRTITRNSFVIPNVAPGGHIGKVTVTTADGKVLTTPIVFTMTELWTGSPLPADDSAVRTEGSLKCAYAVGNGSYTLNGVNFSCVNGSIDNENISWPFSGTSPSSGPAGVASGDYKNLLTHCWWVNAGEKEVTLKGLTPGNKYLVQIFGYRNYSGYEKAHVWVKESFRDTNYMKILGDGWTCGGSLTGIFTASAATKTITLCGDNNWAVNGIQVRDLGQSGDAPIVVRPSIGTVSANTNGTTATVFLSGIVLGTDDAGNDATSYSVSYQLDGADPEEALSGQSGSSVQFSIADLADGDHTCIVTITTDKNKTSAAKSVSFTIGTPPPPVIAPSIGSASASVSGSNATITVSGIVMGTDNSGAEATSYDVSYVLNDAAAVPVLSGQTGASAQFSIADLADGSYTCVVTITTDKSKTASKTASFTIDTSSQGGGGGEPVEAGWTGSALGATSASIRTDGTLKYAYAAGNYTVNGVAFSASSGLINTADCVVWEATTGAQSATPTPPSGIDDVDYKNMLGHCWWAGAKGRKIQLNNLESGKQYLVQIIAFNQTYTTQSATAPDGTTTVKFGGTGWEYGSSLVGVFTASGASEEFTIEYSGNACINAIQVRELGEGGGGGGEDPIDPVDPVTPVYTLTIPAKAGLFLDYVWTNSVRVEATSGVYMFPSNTPVTVTFTAASDYEIVSGNPVEFTITGDKTFGDADYPVVKLSGGGSEGGEPDPVPEAGWTAEAVAADGSTIRTNGTPVYAYAVQAGVLDGVEFTRAALFSDAYMVSASPESTWSEYGSFAGASGYFGTMLSHSWYWDVSGTELSVELTLKGLTKGKEYLVQLIAQGGADGTTVSANGSATVPIHGSGSYGGSIVGVFTATSAVQSVVVTYSSPSALGRCPLNAIQVRDLGGEGEAGSGDGWVAAPLGATPDLIATNGALVYAYARGDYKVNGVDFKHQPESGGISNDNCVVKFSFGSGYGGIGSGGYEQMLEKGWWDVFGDKTVTLNNLEVGRRYLVQIIAYRGDYTNAMHMAIAPDGATIKFAGAGWEHGGSLSYVFTAEAATQEFTIHYVDNACLTALQVRDLDSSSEIDPGLTDGWIARALDSTGSNIATTGKVVYAYARGNYTVNGVKFAAQPENGGVSNENCVVDIKSGFGNGGAGEGGFDSMREKGWWNTAGVKTVALKNLAVGKKYLVEIIAYRDSYSTSSAEAPDGATIWFAGEGWEYGGSLSHVFTAEAATQEFTINYSGTAILTAIQVRDLDASEPAELDPPEISGVVIGSDAVSITINNAVSGQTYGYKKSTTLEGLKTAEVIYFSDPSQVNGILALQIDRDPNVPTCFYQIVVGE